jgi:dTDP-4-dehydrorhamnose reductase
LLLGANGQVGWELARLLPRLGTVAALDRNQCDLMDLKRVRDVIREFKPGVVVNAAAYTAVDQAEREPDIARVVNAEAPAVMAEELWRTSGLLVHYSTDYVFDGTATGPYIESDAPNPLTTYGATKLEGERAIAQTGVQHMVFRTSWVYGTRGKNFLLTMLRLFGERTELKVVDDQVGAPTWCRWIASQTVNALRMRSEHYKAEHGARWNGIFHMTAGGATSWYGFASAIRALHSGSEGAAVPRLVPIDTAQYPTPAKRPHNSILSNAKLAALLQAPQPSWDSLLRQCFETFRAREADSR